MSNWVPIQYRDFWDAPRMVFLNYRNNNYLLDCCFDESLEDYPDSYKVYLMPSLTDADLAGPWIHLPSKAFKEIGQVPVASVRFDSSKRREMDTAFLDKLLQSCEHPPTAIHSPFPGTPAGAGTGG